MNIGRIFAHAIVRRIAYVLVALVLAYVGIGKAHAQAPPNTCNTGPACNQQQAWQSCMAHAAYNDTRYSTQWGPAVCIIKPNQAGVYWCERHVNASAYTSCDPTSGFAFTACPAGTTWNEASHTCWVGCTAGEVQDPEHPGQCLDGQDCLNRNTGITGDGVRPWSSRCISGCNIAVTPGTSSSASANGGAPVWRGRFEYDGQVCSGGVVQHPDPDGTRTDEKTKPQECVPAGSGQTMCVKPTGENCYTASTGKQICWTPGETGKKTDGPLVQERKPGLLTPPDQLVLPNGDTADKTGAPTQTTATKPGGSTVTTTTTNYVTNSGADAGSGKDGEKNDGTGAPEGDGDENKSTGGADCAAPPSSSGDQLLAQIAHQEWLQRCGTSKSDANGDGQPDWTSVDGMDMTPGADRTQAEVWQAGNGDDFEPDDSGFLGGGECKQPPDVTLPNGSTLHFDITAFCSFLQIGAALVLLFAALACGKIIGGAF